MSAQLLHPHIEKTEGQPARLKSQTGTRVAQIVMDYLAHGWSAEEMCRQHPYLTPAEAHAAMAYYYDHLQEIDEEIKRDFASYLEARSQAELSPFARRIRASGRS